MDDLRETAAMSQCSGYWGKDCAVHDTKGSCSDCQQAADRFLAAIEASGHRIVPVEPTEEMHEAARDWSIKKYGQAIGNDASDGCYRAMLTTTNREE